MDITLDVTMCSGYKLVHFVHRKNKANVSKTRQLIPEIGTAIWSLIKTDVAKVEIGHIKHNWAPSQFHTLHEKHIARMCVIASSYLHLQKVTDYYHFINLVTNIY
jgi:hypothetical protein